MDRSNSQASFKRNNEKDVVKDKPLSEAEKNVLYGCEFLQILHRP